MEPKYVFVVGLPRTGTKLVESILSNSPHIEYRSSGETFFVGHFLRGGVRHKLSRFGDLTRDGNVQRLVDYLYSGELPGGYWRRLASGSLGVSRAGLLQAILESDRSPRAIYAILLRAHTAVNPRTVLGDKTPAHLYHVPLLLNWFPEARIVHTFRDPRAIVASELLKRLERKPAEYLPVRRGHPLYAGAIAVHITASWLYAAHLHRCYQSRFPQHYVLCQFEELVREPERNVRHLCAALGLVFDEAMLAPRRAGSSYERAQATGFDTEAVDRWQTVLPAGMRAWVNLWTRLERPAFNYR